MFMNTEEFFGSLGFVSNSFLKRDPPLVRVGKMFEQVQSKLLGAPKYLLVLLPKWKNWGIYENKYIILTIYATIFPLRKHNKLKFGTLGSLDWTCSNIFSSITSGRSLLR
ncbi:hypothetical protein R3W88_016304 [Solanum pinnatisectum]|uniref:Uncharacterized protein n=1 Tax=Solanum pinnatisectum TaxID=50273 RepID=A0AAV9KXF2_9SOLN|nr:hypothetical protein R3W88_016304 [Solanum pinnatisectum]